jgi:hypothetical protein
MTKEEIAETKRLALAHRLMEVVKSEMWVNIVVPYLKDEQTVLIENMASQTESLQLMRYAGSMQTLNSMIHLEAKCKQVIEGNMERKLKHFN